MRRCLAVPLGLALTLAGGTLAWAQPAAATTEIYTILFVGSVRCV